MKENPGFIFLPGAGLSSRIWYKIPPLLDYPALAVDYPGRPEDSADKDANRNLRLEDYSDRLMQQISGWGTRDLIIVAHSIGGLPGLKIAGSLGSRVSGFVALSAVIPENGGSFMSALPFAQRIIFNVMLRIAGTKPPDSAIAKSLCNDLDKAETEEIVRNYVPESLGLYTDRSEADIPAAERMYIKLTADQGLPPRVQERMAKNLKAPWVVSIDSGHLPMLSHPAELAQILNRFAELCSK